MTARGVAFVSSAGGAAGGGGGSGASETRSMGYPGTLAVTLGTARMYVEASFTIVSCRASIGTTCAGSSVIVDVNKNGTTIYTTQGNRPTIAAAGFTGTGTPDVTGLVAGDFLTVDIDQVGSTTGSEGKDLVVSIYMVQV